MRLKTVISKGVIMTQHECKNCGETILPEDIEFLRCKIKQLKDDIEILECKLEAVEHGFCDELCEDRFNGDA